MTGKKPVFEVFAPAKINLYLRVGALGPDGLHPLDSLVAFASIGDVVRVRPGHGLSLKISGPFAASLTPQSDNLVMRAAAALAQAFNIDPDYGADITLEKNLPVASGVGGGSSDAAAALKALVRLWNIAESADLSGVARALGADAPACLAARPLRMRGVGDMLDPAVIPAGLGVVLANIGEAVPTGAIYERFDAMGLGTAFREASPPETTDADDFIAALARAPNDLEAPAFSMHPGVGALKTRIAALPGCALARMSGSGGTVFGLFASPDLAHIALRALRRDAPGLWAQAGVLES